MISSGSKDGQPRQAYIIEKPSSGQHVIVRSCLLGEVTGMKQRRGVHTGCVPRTVPVMRRAAILVVQRRSIFPAFQTVIR